MRRFIEQRAWWVIVFWTLVLFLLLLASCATAPSARKYVGPAFDSKTSSQIEESFPVLWEKWTVRLGAGAGGEKPWRLSTPFSMAGGERYGRGSGDFPLQIAATLMDSLLIEAGLRHYAAVLAMTAEEQTEFRRYYFQRYDLAKHLLIWCDLRTTWAENYLDPDRWIIFLENDAGSQYEPVQIWEESQPASETAADRFQKFSKEQVPWGWQLHRKALMLCFPKRDVFGTCSGSGSVRFLKLVFQLSEYDKTRAEGIWMFKK